MDPEDFLDLAEEWAAGSREGEWRSSVSRSYYACFHAARHLLTVGGFRVPDADRAHGYLWLRLQNSGHLDVQNAGKDLKELRSLRNRADYDLDTPVSEQDAVAAASVARKAFETLIAIANEPAILARVVAAIRTYETGLGEVTWIAPANP